MHTHALKVIKAHDVEFRTFVHPTKDSLSFLHVQARQKTSDGRRLGMYILLLLDGDLEQVMTAQAL